MSEIKIVENENYSIIKYSTTVIILSPSRAGETEAELVEDGKLRNRVVAICIVFFKLV